MQLLPALPSEISSFLAPYQLLPRLQQELLIDQVIADITLTPAAETAALHQFYQQQRLTSDTARATWSEQHGLSQAQVKAIALRQAKIEVFKHQHWDKCLETYFLKRKQDLDRVIYSLLTTDRATVQELWFRIAEQECSFAETARVFAQGQERLTNGITGPTEVGNLHLLLANCLATAQVGVLQDPLQLSEHWLIVRLEHRLPAQFDRMMKQRLLNELFAHWLQEQAQPFTTSIAA